MKGLLTRKLLWKKTKSYPVNFTTYDDDDYFIGRKRLVSFKNVVSVVLIPTRNDYRLHNVSSKIWYSSDDYFGFREDYINELKEEENKKKYNTI